MIVVGLTGQTGAGKSTVGDFLRKQGYVVIDCDRVSRDVTNPGSPCLAALSNEFSSVILSPDGSLNRKALGRIVFSDREKLNRLNRLIFPFITDEIDRRVSRLSREGHRLVVLDAPTLFESGVDQSCRKIISVTAKDDIRLSRIQKRDGITREDALRRMNSQLDERFFCSHSDFVVENNDSQEKLCLRLLELDEFLQALLQKQG